MTTGRPTAYRDEFVQQAYKYLDECKDKEEEFHKTRGEKSDSYDRVLKVKLPTHEGLARYLKVAVSSVYEWAKVYPDFSEALEAIKTEQKERLLNEGLSGNYNSTIAKLILSHNHGMSEKSLQEVTGTNGGPIVVVSRIPDASSS